MTPLRFATGISIAATAALWLVWRAELGYLHRYWAVIAAAHLPWLALAAGTFAVTLFAALYELGRWLGFGDLGRRVQHVERELLAGGGQDRELGAALRRDRDGQL